ncbi:hypothetical protein H4R27_006558, partial [Coemansia aciculifera]
PSKRAARRHRSGAHPLPRPAASRRLPKWPRSWGLVRSQPARTRQRQTAIHPTA